MKNINKYNKYEKKEFEANNKDKAFYNNFI